MNSMMMGPTLPISEEIDKMKYRGDGEDFASKVYRISATLADNDGHRVALKDILGNMRFLPAGRVQTDIGSPRQVTAFNCFVSGVIEDSFSSIMEKATEAAETMRRGGGIGYDFSRIRPRGDWIKSLDSRASGPISFMQIFDSVCKAISSAGHRRGAQMAVLRIDSPSIEEFITCKNNSDQLTGFNISVGVTDEFMEALETGTPFQLKFEGKVYKEVDPVELWEKIMRSTWDWAEPGVLFLDTINKYNNLWYCETLEATNPCAEQCLPPYGACLLGSFNLTQYVTADKSFDFDQMRRDIYHVVRAMDNVIDKTSYPLPQQKQEAKNKRRMGLGVTGLANAGEMMGLPYATEKFLDFQREVLACLRDETYAASALLAGEKGAFPMFKRDLYLQGEHIKTLPDRVRNLIQQHGIRNSHLTSIAPTGTISLSADNVSSGIEPPFALYYDRTIQTFDGPVTERVEDYAFARQVSGRTANGIEASEHMSVLLVAQEYIDSACSKTCNVGDHVKFEDFKKLYYDAWKGGAKGCTTFRASGKRWGVLNEVAEEPAVEACFIDPQTGTKTCE